MNSAVGKHARTLELAPTSAAEIMRSNLEDGSVGFSRKDQSFSTSSSNSMAERGGERRGRGLRRRGTRGLKEEGDREVRRRGVAKRVFLG